jgi:putative hydrolase of the HAD superfamily
MRLVCSSEVGVGKPHARFYEQVIQTAEVPAASILFVGDHLGHDVVGPIEHGMRAAWINWKAASGSPPEAMVDGTLALTHISQLLPFLGIEAHLL